MTTGTKQPTKAWLEVQAYREQLNEGRECLIAEDFSSVVFLYENSKNKPCAAAYKGRSKKRTFCYYYENEVARSLAVKKLLKIWEKSKVEKEKAVRSLVVGDVLSSSWGYDQTNVCFYKVLKLIGKQSVELVSVGCFVKYDGNMTGKKVPDVSNVRGEAFVKRVSGKGDSVSINSFESAYRLEYKEVAGVRIYEGQDFSSYA
jgi:hypothetical protein